MFTGIIKYTGKVKKASSTAGGKRIEIEAEKEFLQQLESGLTSVSINGACHTVEKIEIQCFSVFSSFETLERTNIGMLKSREIVNLELPLTINTFLDGHVVLGHIDDTGKIVNITKKGEAFLFRFKASEKIFDYLVEKDSIAIDGISLTIFNIKNNSFEVAVIPETINKTNLKFKKVGDIVNLEINIFAKYAKKFYNNEKEQWNNSL
ncbi:MAG: riboflavin synthase [Brevinematia bacterium]